MYIYEGMVSFYGGGRVWWAGQRAWGVALVRMEPPCLVWQLDFQRGMPDVITKPGEHHPGQLPSPGDTTCGQSYR